MKYNKGFTLVEMKIALVIMVILAVVVSIYYVSVRDKARIARAKSFEAQLVRTLQTSNLRDASFPGQVLEMTFDDGTFTNPFSDGDDTTIPPAPNANIFIDDTDCMSGKCLVIDNQSEVLSYDFNNNQPNWEYKYAAMAWVKFTDNPTGNQLVKLLNNAGIAYMGRYIVNGNISLVGSIKRDDDSLAASPIPLNAATINNKIWHHLAILYNGKLGTLALYIDGEQRYREVFSPGKIKPLGPGSPLFINFSGFTARMDSIRIFYNAPEEF